MDGNKWEKRWEKLENVFGIIYRRYNIQTAHRHSHWYNIPLQKFGIIYKNGKMRIPYNIQIAECDIRVFYHIKAQTNFSSFPINIQKTT